MKKGKCYTVFSFFRILIERNCILLQSYTKQIIPTSKYFQLGSLELQVEQEFFLDFSTTILKNWN